MKRSPFFEKTLYGSVGRVERPAIPVEEIDTLWDVYHAADRDLAALLEMDLPSTWARDAVRERLAANPEAYKIETDKAELFAIGDFLTPEECQRLCVMVDDTARPSSLHEIAYDSGFRTSYSGDLNPHNSFVKDISKRIDQVLGVNAIVGEPIQGQRYEIGQEFKPHNDWFYTSEKYWLDERKRGGQRCWTAMAWLVVRTA